MNKDITYSEIESVKSSINEFIKKISEIAESEDYKLDQNDKEFFIFISKHIIFFKYLYFGMNEIYFFKVIISDLYYYILSIVKRETRYMYLNERSIIENYTRASTYIFVEQDHVTENLFKLLKEKEYLFKFTDNDYSLIKDEYTTSCGYIHGGDILNSSLVFAFNECISNKEEIENKNKYYLRIRNIMKIYDKILISTYSEKISGCFHRKKSLLKYLVGEECVELLFKADK